MNALILGGRLRDSAVSLDTEQGKASFGGGGQTDH